MKKYFFTLAVFILASVGILAQTIEGLNYTEITRILHGVNYWLNSPDSTTTILTLRNGTTVWINQTIDGSVTIGEVCEITSSGWNEADASAEATCDGLIGIYLGSNVVVTQGIYVTTSLTAGNLYWVSETEAAYTSTKPTTAGTIVKFVGQAISTTQLLLFQNVWLEN
jgi:hypothetical protein